MSRYVATKTFRDEEDGSLIRCGITHVDGIASVYQRHPEKFRIAPDFPAREITRAGGVTTVSRPRRKPAWLLATNHEPDPWRLD